VSSTEAIGRAATSALQVDLPMASATSSNPDPTVGEECQKTNLDTAVGGGGVRRLDLKAVAATFLNG
jgi:hypothetical protein